MRERITQIAKGIVSYDVPRFRTYPDRLAGKLAENQSVMQEAEVRTCNGKPVKGVACSDCPHVKIRGGSFKGYVNRMTVEIDALGLTAGDVLTGQLVLITDGGEHFIPYTYQVIGTESENHQAESGCMEPEDVNVPVFADAVAKGVGTDTDNAGLQGNTEDAQRQEPVQTIMGHTEQTGTQTAARAAELIGLLLRCLTENYSKDAMEELELTLMIWQEEAEPFLTEAQNSLLQIFVMYHTNCSTEGANLYEQIREQIYADREKFPWAYLLGLYLEDRLLPEDSRGSQIYQLQQYQAQHKDVLSLLLLSEVDLNRMFHPKTIVEELCAAYDRQHSPFLLWKLFCALEEAPQMMDLRSRPMVQALAFGIRYGMVPVHIIPVVLDALQKGTKPVSPRVLLRSFLRLDANEAYEGVELLGGAVTLMLQLQLTGARYFPLYHQAACANMHSEELFAHYLDSIPAGCRKPIARPVVLYYTYGDSLSEHLRELLYTNVQLFYSDEERIYTGYASRIERFMIEHLLQGQINENLLYLYTTLLHAEMLDERAAAALTDIFSLKHVCAGKQAVKAVVRDPLLEQEWIFDLTDGEGDVTVWSRDGGVHCLDETGNQLDHASVEINSWMEDQLMERRCRQLCPSHIRFQLEELKELLTAGQHTKAQLDTLIGLANTLPVNWETACRIVSVTIAYCKANPEDAAYDGVLAGASWESLTAQEQEVAFGLLLRRGYVKEAENRIRAYGWNQLSQESLCTFLRLRREKAGKSDGWQTAMCYELYEKGCRENWLLEELCLHYSGSQAKMISLLQDCLQINGQAHKLGERLLVQSMFSGMWDRLPEIMGSYIDAGGEDTLLMSSYLVLRCQVYYMTGLADSVLQGWFAYPSVQETFQGRLPEICCMALLKWYSEQEQLAPEVQQLCISLAEGLLQRGRCYSFFHKYADRVQVPAQLEGKIILEYHGAGSRQVMLVYQRDSLEKDEKVVLFKEQYPGVYTAAISLFAGEELRYRLLEDGEYQAVCFTLDKPFSCKNRSYASLNQAILAYEQGDWQQVQQTVREREINRSIIRRLFPMNCISEEG